MGQSAAKDAPPDAEEDAAPAACAEAVAGHAPFSPFVAGGSARSIAAGATPSATATAAVDASPFGVKRVSAAAVRRCAAKATTGAAKSAPSADVTTRWIGTDAETDRNKRKIAVFGCCSDVSGTALLCHVPQLDLFSHENGPNAVAAAMTILLQ